LGWGTIGKGREVSYSTQALAIVSNTLFFSLT